MPEVSSLGTICHISDFAFKFCLCLLSCFSLLAGRKCQIITSSTQANNHRSKSFHQYPNSYHHHSHYHCHTITISQPSTYHNSSSISKGAMSTVPSCGGNIWSFENLCGQSTRGISSTCGAPATRLASSPYMLLKNHFYGLCHVYIFHTYSILITKTTIYCMSQSIYGKLWVKIFIG